MSNVIELRLLDHCVHPMCYVMDVMTNLRQYYSNSHKITKREDITNPFEVLKRQTLEVENIDEKNKYLTILFFSQLYTHLHTCQKSHPNSSSSLGSRCVPWLGEGLSMSSPNDPVLCCPLPYRVAPVFVQVVSPPLGWSPLTSFLVIWSPSGDARGPSVVFEAVDICPAQDHFIFLTV